MKRTEALRLLEDAQNEVVEAQTVLYWRQLDLEESECDHPDTHGHVCDHCGEYEADPETREQEDFLRVLYADTDALQKELGHIYRWMSPGQGYGYPTPAHTH